MREMPYALKKLTDAPYKLQRDVEANVVEAVFLSSSLARLFNQTHEDYQIGLPFKIDQHVYTSDSPIDSRFTLLLRV